MSWKTKRCKTYAVYQDFPTVSQSAKQNSTKYILLLKIWHKREIGSLKFVCSIIF